MDREASTVLGIVLLMLFVSAGVVIFTIPRFSVLPDRISEYSASITYDGSQFVVCEHYNYVLGLGKHLIYRNWDVPVTIFGNLKKPHVRILSIDCPEGTVPYARIGGKTYIYHNGGWIARKLYPSVPYYYINLARKDEVGCASTAFSLPPGNYHMTVRYQIFPPLQCDDKYCHANIALAGDDHFPYSSVRAETVGSGIVEHTTRPKTWFLSLFGLPDNVRLEREFLLEKTDKYPFIVPWTNVMQEYEEKRGDPYLWAEVLAVLVLLTLFLAPLYILYYWWRHGRERKHPDVPDFLTNVPNPERKPWIVNAVFDGSAGKTDVNAFIATLMDLERRGYVEFIPKGNKTLVRILKDNMEDLDPYERTVLSFLLEHSVNNTFDPDAFKREIKHADARAFEILQTEWKGITTDVLYAKMVAHIYISYPRLDRFYLTLGVLGFFSFVSFFLTDLLTGFFLASAFAFILDIFFVSRISPDVLGTWKKDYGKEFAQWQAFKRFLSDLTRIKQYSEHFRSMWREWLIYGAALGVAENVLRAMRDIKIPEFDHYHRMYLCTYRSFYSLDSTFALKAAELAAKNASTGGGFGAGGGFGGGGAGAR